MKRSEIQDGFNIISSIYHFRRSHILNINTIWKFVVNTNNVLFFGFISYEGTYHYAKEVRSGFYL